MKYLIPLSTLTLAFTLTACGAKDRTVDLGEAKQVDAPFAGQAAPSAQPMAPASAPAVTGFKYEIPEGWTERAPSGMRVADFQVGAADADAECYVTRLPGPGGGLEANLNRWRTQMGLEAYTPEDIAALPRIAILGTEAPLVSFTGTFAGMGGTAEKANYGLLGVIAELPGESVFVKLTGPADLVATQNDPFKAFVASLAPDASAASAAGGMMAGALPDGHPPVGNSMPNNGTLPDGHPPIGGAATAAPGALPEGHPALGGVQSNAGETASGKYTWEAPTGWEPGPPKSMRLVTYKPQGNAESECYIMPLAGTAGGMHANVNRWRSQMGQPPLSDEDIDALPRIDVKGQPSVLVEANGPYTDMMGAEHTEFGLLGVIWENETESLFIKFVGPLPVIQAEKDAFIAFCKSIQ